MDRENPTRSLRSITEHRLGLVGAAAVVVAAVAGTLAAASPVSSPTSSTTAQAAQWGDPFDHVVLMADGSVIVDPEALRGGDRADIADRDRALAASIRAVEGVQQVAVVAPGTYAVATAGERTDLLAVPGIEGLIDDLLLSTQDDPLQNQQWAIANTGAPEQSAGLAGTAGADAHVVPAWTTATGAGSVVAVIDSGVQLDHPDLAGRLWSNSADLCGNGADDDSNGYIDDCAGWDFGMNDADPSFDAGSSGFDHGTHVAGIVAAGRNAVGVVGVAPDATVMALKASIASTGALPMSSIIGAIDYAVAEGADVLNMSFGTLPGTARASVSALETAVQYAVSQGVAVVAAAGNSGVDTSSALVFPAAFSLDYPGVVTVGSTTNTDVRSSFSNFGTPVNLYAPGSVILSTIGSGGHGYKSGTSMAAPMVAGAVAAMLSLDPTLTPAAIRTQLLATARPLSWGAPMLDVAAAVGATPPVASPGSSQVVYEGADMLQAGVLGTIGVRVTAPTLPASVVGAKVSLATLDGGAVYAVDGLAVGVGTAAGVTNRVSATDGSLPSVPLAADTLQSTGVWRFTLAAAIPIGSYALVTDLVDASGAAVGGSFVGFLQVSNTPAAAPTTTTVGSPVSTVAGATTTIAGATTLVAAPSTTAAAGATTTSAGVPTTVAATTTTVKATTTTVAGATTTVAAPSTTAAAGATTTSAGVSTTVAATTTTVKATTTTVAGATTTVGAPSTTAAAGATTTTSVGGAVTTTPTPSTVVAGPYRVDSMTPRTGPTAGGTAITISGAFPTSVPVYVWFGPSAVAPAVVSGSGSTLTLTSPQVLTAGVVDITVRFTTSQSYALVYAKAYTYADGVIVAPTTTIAGGATTLPAATTTTVKAATTTTGAPTTTSAAGTTTTVAAKVRSTVRLQPLPATGSLSKLNPLTWPVTACSASSCPASTI